MVIRKKYKTFKLLYDAINYEINGAYAHPTISGSADCRAACNRIARQIAGIEELDTDLFESLGISDDMTDTLNDLEDLVTGYPTQIKDVSIGWGTVTIIL